ncbi:MAG TPA: hypothetical protein VNU44_14515 [Bryobacteraceae bacterium]|nr:hypothetical protein [Bryobacteraceae bacterium]
MGYQDFLDIGEQLCQLSETELLKMNRAAGATTEQILSAQEQCRAQRVFFERWQMEMQQQVKTFVDEQEARGKPQPPPVAPEPAMSLGDAAEILGLIPESTGEAYGG